MCAKTIWTASHKKFGNDGRECHGAAPKKCVFCVPVRGESRAREMFKHSTIRVNDMFVSDYRHSSGEADGNDEKVSIMFAPIATLAGSFR